MSVTVDTKKEAERLLLEARRFPYFETVTLSGITESESEAGVTSVSFSLTCRYKKLEDSAEGTAEQQGAEGQVNADEE